MSELELGDGELTIKEDVETYYRKKVTEFGTSAKVGVSKKYRGREALVIILKE